MKFLNILALATLCSFSASHSINFKALAASALTFDIVCPAAASIFPYLIPDLGNVGRAVHYLGKRLPSYKDQILKTYWTYYLPANNFYLLNQSKIKGLVGITVGALAAIKVYNYLDSKPENN